MKFLNFRERFHGFNVFSVHDITKADPDFDTRRLVEWQKKGYIRKIINRWYMFSDVELHEELLYYIANHIYAPSYISLESAFSYYHLIPEGVYSLTSVTSIKTNHFQTPVGMFSYRHVKPALMFGYRLLPFASTELPNRSIRMAEMEKALTLY